MMNESIKQDESPGSTIPPTMPTMDLPAQQKLPGQITRIIVYLLIYAALEFVTGLYIICDVLSRDWGYDFSDESRTTLVWASCILLPGVLKLFLVAGLRLRKAWAYVLAIALCSLQIFTNGISTFLQFLNENGHFSGTLEDYIALSAGLVMYSLLPNLPILFLLLAGWKVKEEHFS